MAGNRGTPIEFYERLGKKAIRERKLCRHENLATPIQQNTRKPKAQEKTGKLLTKEKRTGTPSLTGSHKSQRHVSHAGI